MKIMLSEALRIDLEDFYGDQKDDVREILISPENASQILEILTEKHGEIENYTNVRLALENSRYSSIRDLLQTFGTDICRQMIDPEIWVKMTLNSLDPFELSILPDSRFPNERAAIKQMGGLLMLVNRDLPGKDGHISENQLDGEYDFVVENSGGLGNLLDEISLWHSLRFPEIARK